MSRPKARRPDLGSAPADRNEPLRPPGCWAWAEPGDRVMVHSADARPYPARVDARTEDGAVIWVVSDLDGGRRAFDASQRIDILPLTSI